MYAKPMPVFTPRTQPRVFFHMQNEPAKVWRIVHNLGTMPRQFLVPMKEEREEYPPPLPLGWGFFRSPVATRERPKEAPPQYFTAHEIRIVTDTVVEVEFTQPRSGFGYLSTS